MLEKISIIPRFHRYLLERFSLYAALPAIALQYLLIHYYTTGESLPQINVVTLTGFLTFFIFLVILRLFDEIKDKDHDDVYYKERPVQRGLISLAEIKKILIGLTVFVFLLNIPNITELSFWIFTASFLYLILMRYEFFAPDYLKPRLILYLISHQLFVPLLVSYLLYLGNHPIRSLSDILFLGLNLLLIMSVEIARKTRSSEEENKSKDTYSAYLGKKGALLFLFFIIVLTDILFINVFSLPNAIFITPIFLVLTFSFYLKNDTTLSSKAVLATTVLINFALIGMVLL